ncbi:hypothetical protein [Tropicibacter sp. S64]|uniref:hypothetical protein n=1 Tax=Tropicibacter sp. S64 TaxID=3415122 RepID=UPI003C7EA71A
MKKQPSRFPDDSERLRKAVEAGESAPPDAPWFELEPSDDDPDLWLQGPRADPDERAVVAEWAEAEASRAAQLARVAGRLGALDDRLLRGPVGWRHRLALIEAADLSWFSGERVSPDRLALWTSMRLSGVQEDVDALASTHWAVRRLKGGPGPLSDLAAFLDRRDPERLDKDAERFEDRADAWLGVMKAASSLHPITRACMGFHLWSLAGLSQNGPGIEAAVTVARVAAEPGRGAVFAPVAMGGAAGLRAAGLPSVRLARWLDGMENAIMTAMRHLDDVEKWAERARDRMASLSGRTPAALTAVFKDWPIVSAPMAETLTGASRASVQRNLNWMADQGLVREVTGQGRFRLWRIATRVEA